MFLGVLFAVRDDVLDYYVVRLNCGHVELAEGLYTILNKSIALNSFQQAVAVFPEYQDLKTPQSTLDVLTNYARREVLEAPQYFLMGFKSFCSFRFETNYDLPQDVNINFSFNCTPYDANNFDYEHILLNSGFLTLLLYANAIETDLVETPSHKNLYTIFKAFSIVEFVLLPFQFFSTLFVYSRRGNKPDLSSVKLVSHIPLVISVVSCVAMSLSFGLLMRFLTSQISSIKKTLGMFKITMTYGPAFLGLFITVFVLTACSMLIWVIPMWCSNPPELDEQVRHLLPKNTIRHFANASSSEANDLEGIKLTTLLPLDGNTALGLPQSSNSSLSEVTEITASTEILSPLDRSHTEIELKRLGDQLTHRPHVRKSSKFSP